MSPDAVKLTAEEIESAADKKDASP